MADVRPREVSPPAPLEAVYISYDGLLEPMGRSQVVPYVAALADAGVRLAIVSFEKPDDLDDTEKRRELRRIFDDKAIDWTPLTYHKRPRVAATLCDIAVGAWTALRLARSRGAQVVHARSYVAGLMGWLVKAGTGARFVFDMRGFWPEERVELGLFRPHGALYRLSKAAERFLLDASDHVVVLTESAKAILRDREADAHVAARRSREKQITVIPCCVDLERFQPRPANEALRDRHGLSDCIVIGNVGAVNQRYMLPEMFRFAFHVKSHRPQTRFVYITRQSDSGVLAAAKDAGLQEGDIVVRSSEPSDVPEWLSLFRLGVFFLRPSYAAKASSYTKLAEFLACGVPVVTNKGVGDVDVILDAKPCGILVSGLKDTDLAAAARHAVALLDGDDVPNAVRRSGVETAASRFALGEGANRYLAIYRSLVSPASEEPAAYGAVELG